jgi:cholesterol oxidase
MSNNQFDYDVVVIGSGFGGSVTALRLTEKGYRVGVLEAGRRFTDDQFAKTSWDVRRFVWAPKLGCFGIQRIHLLRDSVILAGAGVGGGSLNYANTLYKPPTPFFQGPQWADITDWEDELTPYYEQGQRMLGVVRNPHVTPADEIIKAIAEDMGVGDTFIQTPVGVFFGEPGKTVPDPFFGGAGPERTGCIECGDCMVGCRYGAKNTLVKNYLGLAERAGATVHPLTTVTSLQQRPDGVWNVDTVRTGAVLRKKRHTFTAPYVVLAAGTWGTQNLLHKRQGLQFDGNAADPDDGRRWSLAALAEVPRPGREEPGSAAARADREELERANRHHLGDAAPGQLHHHLHQARTARAPSIEQARPRPAQPDVDPGRQRSDPQDRREDPRRVRRKLG